jgi:hypothetical protein
MKDTLLRKLIREEIQKELPNLKEDSQNNYEYMIRLAEPNLMGFIKSASKITETLKEAGYEAEDIYEFLYNVLLNDV